MEPVVHTEASAAQRLHELGIPQDYLLRAVQGGEAEARAWTEAAPRSMSGMARWGRTNELIRTNLARVGFTYENPNGLPVTISPDHSFNVVATTGDGHTGRTDGPQPTTRYAKGTATAKAVEVNGVQLALDFVDAGIGPALAEAASCEGVVTWIVLYHVAPEGIYVELSLPESISRRGYIDRWRERIILPMYEYDSESQDESTFDQGNDGFNVAVERR
jgi:hypothetical protein